MKIINKVKTEKGQIADILMFFFFIVFVIYFIILFTSMQLFFNTQKMVDSVVRDEIEIVRTKGILTTSEYENFLGKLGKYGNFNIIVIAEKQDEAGNRGRYFSLDTILDKPFKVGDFIKFFVESKKPSLFADILQRNFMFGYNGKGGSSFRMQSQASGMVCSDGFIKGIEVINIINKYFDTGVAQPADGIFLQTLNYTSIPVGQDPTSLSANIVQQTGKYDVSIPERTTDKWIDYEGRYSMEVTPDGDYRIKKIVFTELLKR
ncbi:MAG: hypothetical protein ACM3KR_06145 [Deltaproteobacteria bacterium]